MSPRFILRTLGAFELRRITADGQDGERVLGPGKPLALLAYCCSAREREHSRDALATLLWGDADPLRARQSLRQALWRIRRIADDALVLRDDAVIGVGDSITTDRETFLAALHAGDMRLALDAYGGAFLVGVSLPGGDEFDEWAALERRHLEVQLVRGADPYLQTMLRGGKPAQVRVLAERLLRIAPTNIEAHRVAIECYLASGDGVNARRTATALEQQLHTDSGRIPPSVAALVARTLEPDADGAGGDLRGATIALDLVGRDEAFATALDAWRRTKRGEPQTIVLAGVAGIGKSRLLAAIAERCTAKRTLSISVRANAGERDLPFGFAATIARALASLPGAAGIGADSARELVALDPGLGSVFHAVPSFADGGEAVRRRALAVLDLLTAIAEQEPLALFMDDLHWADAASRQLIAIVLQRTGKLPVFAVGTTRGALAGLFDDRTAVTVQLLPLPRTDVIDAIRSTGEWPDTPEAARFVNALADSCDGIPLQVVERLSLVEERGLVQRLDGVWTAQDWNRATSAAAVTSPMEHRIRDCPPRERTVLTMLAVGGAPLPESVLQSAIGDANGEPRVRLMLLALEAKGLVTFAAGRWSPGHDLVADGAIAVSTADDRTASHINLGRALAASDDADMSAAAVRHLLLAGDDVRAGEKFAQIVARSRDAGDRRSVNELLTRFTGETLAPARVRRITSSVRWWHRVSFPHPAASAMAALLLVALTGGVAWKSTRQPTLTFVQVPMTIIDTPLLGAGVFKLAPAAIVRSADASSGGVQPGVVRVRSLSPGLELVTTDSALVRDGRAAFGALRIRGRSRHVKLRFQADGFAPLDLDVQSVSDIAPSPDALRVSMHIVGGELSGQALTGTGSRVRAARGSTLDGVVQLEYDSPWASASVWLSMTPTWGKPELVGRELEPVVTPVRQEVLDIPLRVQVPNEVGHWWIILMIDAEPSGFFGLSGTNWTVETPLWGDGNDIATLPDATIRAGARRGMLSMLRAIPADWPGRCDSAVSRVMGRSLRYCAHEFAFTAIEVIVE